MVDVVGKNANLAVAAGLGLGELLPTNRRALRIFSARGRMLFDCVAATVGRIIINNERKKSILTIEQWNCMYDGR